MTDINSSKPTIAYDDFVKLDLRVGQVIEATAPEWSQKLLEMKVNFGEEVGERTILAGVQKRYLPEDLIGNKFVFVINLAERKMGPAISQGMMLMAVDKNDQITKIQLPQEVSVGSVIC